MTDCVTSWQRVEGREAREPAAIPGDRVWGPTERALLHAPGMFRRQALIALAVLGLSSTGFAQVFTNISRSGSPRTRDPGGVQGSLNTTSPIGRRDCEGEEWTFTINYSANPGGMTTTSLQYFIGADAMACAMANARAPVTSGTPRCWPIRQTPSLTFTNPTTPLSYTVHIQSRYLVDPEGGNCVTPGTTQGTSNTNYLAVLAFPPSDSNVIGTYPISYDVTPAGRAHGRHREPRRGRGGVVLEVPRLALHDHRRRHHHGRAAGPAGLLAALRPASGLGRDRMAA